MAYEVEAACVPIRGIATHSSRQVKATEREREWERRDQSDQRCRKYWGLICINTWLHECCSISCRSLCLRFPRRLDRDVCDRATRKNIPTLTKRERERETTSFSEEWETIDLQFDVRRHDKSGRQLTCSLANPLAFFPSIVLSLQVYQE